MKCPQCQAENRAGAKFCEDCGASLASPCRACGADLTAGKKFCGSCGAPASPLASPPAPPAEPADRFASPQSYTPKHLAEKILTSKGAIEGERKIVTVMFSDVSGFTAMSEKLDPEDVHGIMDRVFEVILRGRSSLRGHDQPVPRRRRDGALRRADRPRGPRPARAQRRAGDPGGLKPLAEDVRQRTRGRLQDADGDQHGPRRGRRHRARPAHGLHGGGRHHEPRGAAPRHRQAGPDRRQPAHPAPPGPVLHLRGPGRFPGQGQDRAGPRLRASRARSQGRRRLEVSRERGLTPLVGRERELARAHRGLQARRPTGQGAIVLLSGRAGRRQVAPALRVPGQLDGTGTLELETTCVSYGRTMAYRPIVELLRRYLGLSEGVAGEEVRRRVADQLQLLGVRGRGASRSCSPTSSASPRRRNSSIACPGRSSRSGPSTLLRDMFLRASESAPLILILENMHWVDTASEEFLAHLAAGLPGHRVPAAADHAAGLRGAVARPAAGGDDHTRGTRRGRRPGDGPDPARRAEEVSEQLFKMLAEKERGESSLRGGDPPPAPGDGRDRRRKRRGATEPTRRDGPCDHPRHHRGPPRSHRGVAQADASGGGGGGATLRNFPGLSRAPARLRSGGRAPAGPAWPRLRLPERPGSRADVQLQARADPGRGVWRACWSAGGARTTRRPRSAWRSCTPGRTDDVVELIGYHFVRGQVWDKAVDVSPAGRRQGPAEVGAP